MSLKIPVKVSEINNLSDARYCAGMGVDLLGFCLDENHPKYINISKVKEISNWISGIKVVGEFSGNNMAYINSLAEQLSLDFVQVDQDKITASQLEEIIKPVILKVEVNSQVLNTINSIPEFSKGNIKYLFYQLGDLALEKIEVIKNNKTNIPIIIGVPFNIPILEKLIFEVKPYGINLTGGLEIKPGLKDFSDLAEILEYLEESN